MVEHEVYIKRCFELAKKAGKAVESNPQVGAVLLYQNRIIGEGYHEEYGKAHAEVNAINSVKEEDKKYIPLSTLYVSLEPCCIIGKTPACSDLIIRNQINNIVVSAQDPNPKVAGQSLRLLKDQGVTVSPMILEKEGRELIAPFRKNLSGLPFVSLKWAKSKDGFMGKAEKQVWLSNKESKIYAHKLRAENDGIMIGTNTAILDNPQLSLREFPGTSPLRIVLDREGKIPRTHHIFSDDNPSLIISAVGLSDMKPNKENWVMNFGSPEFLTKLLKRLFKHGICRLMVEGGAGLLKSFIQEKLWDSAHLIHTEVMLESGIKSPNLNGKLSNRIKLYDNYVDIIRRFEV